MKNRSLWLFALTAALAAGAGIGGHVRLKPGRFTLQHVKLYRYR